MFIFVHIWKVFRRCLLYMIADSNLRLKLFGAKYRYWRCLRAICRLSHSWLTEKVEFLGGIGRSLLHMIPCLHLRLKIFVSKKSSSYESAFLGGQYSQKIPEPGLAVPPKYRLGATHDSICLTKLTVCLSCAIDMFTNSFLLTFQIYIIPTWHP